MSNIADPPPMTAVNYRHSSDLVDLLDRLNVSVLISTYQAGKVICVGVHQKRVQISFHQFEQAMGMTRTPTGLAVGAKRQIWFLDGVVELGPKVAPAGTFDVAFLARRSHVTGPIMGHEMAWGQDELWVANTGFSCLCTIDQKHNFVPRWKPPFVSKLVGEDRCHLNGLAMDGNEPRLVSVLGQTDTAGGWRVNKASGGCIVDVDSGESVLQNLCMPHSPRLVNGQLLFLDSGRGQLSIGDRSNGKVSAIQELDGYTRGMDIHADHAFIGLSKIRETSVFGGLPIVERRHQLQCGLCIVDLSRGKVVGFLHFDTGVDEVFEVKVIPGYRNPIISGPLQDDERTGMIWLVLPL